MSIISKALRLFHTLRWLRPVQWYARAWFVLWRPGITPAENCALRTSIGVFVPGPQRPTSFVPPDAFTFFNVTRTLSEMGWDDSAVPRLWRYQLHYFDCLGDQTLGCRDAASLIARWTGDNPLVGHSRGGTGWEPYPTSLRIVNWIKWHLSGVNSAHLRLDDAARTSLIRQVRWLCRRLEYHLLGNHLWANAKALVFAGVFFSGREADDWLQQGLGLLRQQFGEQRLVDGGHFELSPMYHAIFVEDVLDLLALDYVYPGAVPVPSVSEWRRSIPLSIEWLRAMTHPDGFPAQFNDTALGEGPSAASLEAYAERLDVKLTVFTEASIYLPASGYVRLQRGPAVVIADVGRAGPDYIPGHAHADALSFEMSLVGRRLFVNGGTSTYDAGPERLRQRGTPAHNTVTVDGGDSSEVWSSFRLGQRIRLPQTDFHRAAEEDILSSCFEGFHAGGSPVTHRRRWQLRDGVLEVLDQVEGGYTRAEARFHVAPGWTVSVDGQNAMLCLGATQVRLAAGRHWRLGRSTWCRGFGEDYFMDVLMIDIVDGKGHCRITWTTE